MNLNIIVSKLLSRLPGANELTCILCFQEICTLYLAVELNGDKMNPLNVVGLILCLAGIALHVVIKAVRGKNLQYKMHLIPKL